MNSIFPNTASPACSGIDRQTLLRAGHDGGDPDNVMVWGESGGGAKTACVYTMPGAANLFHKASILCDRLSGLTTSPRTP